jgi:hypothetical protein
MVAILGTALIAACALAAVSAQPVVGVALSRYPGSVRAADEGLRFEQFRQGIVTRQAVYQTGDELAVVKDWYAERMHLAPATTVNADSSGCAMMSQAEMVYRFEHTLAVVLCARPYGTQVVVNEKLALVR